MKNSEIHISLIRRKDVTLWLLRQDKSTTLINQVAQLPKYLIKNEDYVYIPHRDLAQILDQEILKKLECDVVQVLIPVKFTSKV